MLFFTSEGGVDGVFEVAIYRDNDQGCHFMTCILLVSNTQCVYEGKKLLHYRRNYFHYVLLTNLTPTW